MTAAPTLTAAMDDPALFGPWFSDRESWAPWRAVLKAAHGQPLDSAELCIFSRLTGRDTPPTSRVRELWAIAGRRSGKTRIAATLATDAAAFGDYRRYLAPGERGVVFILAVDKAQAAVALNYVKGFFERIPLLSAMVERETADGLDLTNGVSIVVAANSFRSVRGRTIVLAIFDELAFWRDDRSANPDRETYNAVLPGMATIPTAMLVGISSPYSRRGLLWERFRDHHGQPGDVLVVKSASRDLNPSLPQRIVDEAVAADPQSAASEWLGEFRSDIAGFLDAELVESLARLGPLELPPVPGTRYRAFADPSGGRGDAFTLAISHREGERAVIDLCRAVTAPFDPAVAVRDLTGVLRAYGCRSVAGDRYAGSWVSEAFRAHGIDYRSSSRDKSAIYGEALPLFTRGSIELPPDRRLLVELAQLERRTSRGGKDSIDHPPRSHDDRANAVCGAALLAEEAAVEAAQGPAIRRLRCYA